MQNRTEPTTGEVALETVGLDVGYGSFAVQRDVNLRIERGEIFVLLGGSGCGKSTVMRTLVGLQPPLAGTVKFFGETFAEAGVEPDEAPPLLRRIGVMFQNGALFGSKTLLENCAVPFQTLPARPQREIDEICMEKLESVGLSAFAGHYPSQISGGMQKRAAIADRAVFFDRDTHSALDTGAPAALRDGSRHEAVRAFFNRTSSSRKANA